jgi:nucleoside-triphosphatase THEP1
MEFIKDWILTPRDKLSLQSCLFITGNSGIGKSHNIHKLCSELDLFIININSFNCYTSKQLTDLLYKSFVSSLIQQLTLNTQKKIIIIDEFETLLSFDSTMNIHLFNFLNTSHKHIPIICIVSNNIKLGEIKKKCIFYELPPLNINDIHNILLNYNSSITLTETTNIAKNTNYNIKDCIKIINNTYYNNNDDFSNICELYSNTFNRDNFKKIIYKDQWLIPLKFHENLIIELNTRNITKSQKYNYYKNFIYNFCIFDILMNKNNEIAIDFFISYIYDLCQYKYKNNKSHSLENFTKLLSYLSLQKKNNKKNYKSNFPISQFSGNYHLSIINRKIIY